MEIRITDKFKKFAEKKNIDTIAIKYGQNCTSWAGTVRVPVVLKDKPYDVSNYKYNLVDGVTIYVHKSIKIMRNNHLELTVIGFLNIKEISVRGIEVNM